MFEWPTLGVLIAVAVPIMIIFLVLGIFQIVQRQAERAIRSPEYWDEVPDGKRYPTGWDEEESSSRPASEGRPGPEGGEAEPDTPENDDR
ncbi:hypothetical protein [Nocardiopsis ganjiahuensis]|uniref:hypothetical protein n=1 Tax=Nocardiopsis ganjiahuensis TaxID=239984 RepID=UPI00034C969A|nr:hypothetical protein [Nocardiopsis ganjiahuensis]